MVTRDDQGAGTSGMTELLSPNGGDPRRELSVGLKALVISANGTEADLDAIQAFLGRLGVPYDTLVATDTRLRPELLCDGDHGYYRAVFVTTASLMYFDSSAQAWISAFDEAEWELLSDYERRFRARRVILYTFPSQSWIEQGLVDEGVRDTAAAPLEAHLTPSGRKVFSYLNPTAPIRLSGAHFYQATVESPDTVPLLVTREGHAVVSIRSFPDGREQLAATIANAPRLLHTVVLSYGVVDWAMNGLFIGSGRPNLNAQVDDVFIANAIWDPAAAADNTGRTYRLTSADIDALVSWLDRLHELANVTSDLRLELGFVGYGVATSAENDGLTAALRHHEHRFNWFSHTWDHRALDDMSYEDARGEIVRNDEFARQMGFSHYHPDAVVQGNVSGLDNPRFLQAATACGVRFLVADTSQPAWSAVPANRAVQADDLDVMIIPRRPTNLFCNATTPEEWVAEYNHYYGAHGVWAPGPHDLTYEEILDRESGVLVRYLLQVDMAPLMFHQANLRAYDGKRSLLTDLLDATLQKYGQLVRLPVAGRPLHVVGRRMAERTALEDTPISAVLHGDDRLVISATQPVVVPVTGVAFGDDCEVYGDRSISYIQLKAGERIEIDLAS
jgi:peptidoglycan/xylan/chitin deacetylase (PgdA/CDA1 family)